MQQGPDRTRFFPQAGIGQAILVAEADPCALRIAQALFARCVLLCHELLVLLVEFLVGSGIAMAGTYIHGQLVFVAIFQGFLQQRLILRPCHATDE